MIIANDGYKWRLVGNPADRKYSERKAFELMEKHWTHPIQERAGDKIVEILMNYKANINHEDGDDDSPLDIATDLGNIISLKK